MKEVSLLRSRELDRARGNIVTPRDTNSTQGGYQGLPTVDFNKIKLGMKTLDDAIINLDTLKKVNPRLADKFTVLKAINDNDLAMMREISNFFYRIDGIYTRIIRYMAFMYRYDWMVTPYVNDEKKRFYCKTHGYTLVIIPYWEENILDYDYIIKAAYQN